MKRKLIIFIIFSIVFVLINNNYIVKSRFSIQMDEKYNGYTLVHISDIHNKKFIDGGDYFYKMIKKENPAIIVLTGDLVDRRRYDEDHALEVASHLLEIAPVYFTSGNHEWFSRVYPSFRDKLIKLGVHVISDETVVIDANGQALQIIGLDDKAKYYLGHESLIAEVEQKRVLDSFSYELPTLLLTHRPSTIDLIKDLDVDLILCGHIHGGQIRLPFIGGLLSPDTGMSPDYDNGLYEIEETSLIVSRGIGNSIIPVRVFNLPEIGVITLE
jgi:predicted MPP superfamily phosphohydrolase